MVFLVAAWKVSHGHWLLGTVWLISSKPDWVGACVVGVGCHLSFMCYDSFTLPQVT